MKYLVLILVWITGFAICSYGQDPTCKTSKGKLNDAAFIILIPEDWNQNLVMYAHGYEFVGSSPRQSESPGFENSVKPFLKRGFAVAASDYSIQGFAFDQGVQETEELRQHFVQEFGKPDSTFIVGHSMGGGITLATIEYFGEYYDGGFPMCPLASQPYLQVRKEFDLRATFNGLFPGLTTSLKEIFSSEISKLTPETITFPEMMKKGQQLKEEMLKKDSTLAAEFAEKYYLKLDDLPLTLLFGEQVLRDIAYKAGGNPFDNTNTIYSGFPNDILVNQKAERLTSSVDPSVIFSKFERNGEIEKPVLLMHTIYDQLIPPIYAEVNYENMVTKEGKLDLLTVKYTNGQSHCSFTPEQTGQAFDELRAWVNSGKKAHSGFLK